MKPPEALVLAAGKGSRLFRSPTTIAVFLENLVVISLGYIQDSSPLF
jgi:choline kinase